MSDIKIHGIFMIDMSFDPKFKSQVLELFNQLKADLESLTGENLDVSPDSYTSLN